MERQLLVQKEDTGFKAAFALDNEIKSRWCAGKNKNEAIGRLFVECGVEHIDVVRWHMVFQAACTWTNKTNEAIGRYVQGDFMFLSVRIVRQ